MNSRMPILRLLSTAAARHVQETQSRRMQSGPEGCSVDPALAMSRVPASNV